MTPTPDDIRKAREIVPRLTVPCAADALTIAQALRAEREAERERCAGIAETQGVHPEMNIFAGGPEWYRHGKEIAKAIRRSEP